MHTLLRLIGRQHWARFGIRHRLIRQFVNPETVVSTEFETRFFGLKYRGNLNSFIDWNVFFHGAYEREYLFFLSDLVKDIPQAVFIDIGANVGQHSLFMSLLCDKVHSFEPNPKVRERLEEKIQINHVANITVHDVGLGLQHDELPFFTPQGCNQGTGSFIKGHSDNNNKQGLKLKVVNGDQYISRLELEHIDLIKIDVEGFEKYVLTGLRETLDAYRPLITIEFSAATKESFLSVDDLIALLPPGYRIQRISSNNPFCKVLNPHSALLGWLFSVFPTSTVFRSTDMRQRVFRVVRALPSGCR